MEDKNKGSAINIQILTPSGFQPFDGVARYWHDKSLKFIFEDGSIESAYDHRFIVNSKEVFARDVKIGDNIGKTVKEIIQISEGDYFYDPINVSNGKIYSHDNGFVSHNTFFGTGDTLISADTLMSLRSMPYKMRTADDVFIYEEAIKTHEYIMLVDVAKGRGLDYSTFNVIDVTCRPWKQVAVYRNNIISPILFPNIIYKYATSYNEALVIIENNDAGQLVCNGLYMDLEYENMFVESAIKANSLGINMNRKVKRIGCSGFKDVLENKKLEIVDQNTILEISTFVAKGQSYEASDGNHDDLVMNLVLFGYFISTSYFADITDINIKQMLFEQNMKAIEDDVLPFGFINDNEEEIAAIEQARKNDDWGWAIDPTHRNF